MPNKLWIDIRAVQHLRMVLKQLGQVGANRELFKAISQLIVVRQPIQSLFRAHLFEKFSKFN